MNDDQPVGTPWTSERRSVAPRGAAPTPDEVAARPKGPPPGTGKLPGQGIPSTKGKPPTVGTPPELGRPPGTGRLPGDDGQRARGLDGQVDRGAPGQMDPWAENPWSLDQGTGDDWSSVPTAPEGGDPDAAFYVHHPNLHGTKSGE